MFDNPGQGDSTVAGALPQSVEEMADSAYALLQAANVTKPIILGW